MKRKELLLSLIKDDLIHSKLLLGLDVLGLQTEGFVLSLSETTFALMGIANDEKGEQLFEQYLAMREQIANSDVINLDANATALAKEIYEVLVKGDVFFEERRKTERV